MGMAIGRRQGRVITVRELAQDTSRVLNGLIEDHETACVTRYGRPVALIVPLETEQIESHLFGAILETVRDEEGLDAYELATSKEMAVAADIELTDEQDAE